MANLFLNLPMPTGDGPGAPVDTSAMGKSKSIIVGGLFDNASVSIEASTNGVDFEPIWLFDKPGKKVIDVAAQSMRVNVQGRNFAPFSATADVGANDNGALFVNLPLPVVDGVGAAVDVSALGNFTTFVASGTFRDVSVFVEVSEDGVEYAQCTRNFSNTGGVENKVVVANFMRTRVAGRLNNPFPFSLTMSVGATMDPAGADSIYINVKDSPYNAVGDGVADDTAAIEMAIASATVAEQLPGIAGRSALASVIYFPDGKYLITSEITIPADKNLRLLGTSHNGSILMSGGGAPPDYLFFRDAPNGLQRGVEFSHLVMLRGGVRVLNQSRIYHTFEHVFFKNTPAAGIKLQSAGEVLGASGGVVGGAITKCSFENCFRGILCQGDQSDLWVVEQCQFTRGHRTDIELHSSGWTIDNNYFESRQSLANGGDPNGQDYPWINITYNTNNDASNIVIIHNRFGSETGAGGTQPPREIIVIGTLGASDVGAYQDIRIISNHFRGHQVAPNANSANAAIRFNVGLNNGQIRDNAFYNYNMLVQFAHANNNDGKGNVFGIGTNQYPSSAAFPRVPLFNSEPSQGSLGSWRVIGREAGPDNSWGIQEVEQLVSRTETIDTDPSWVKTNCTVAKNAVGPDGEVNSAYTISKTAGLAHILHNPTSPNGTGPVVCSAYFKRAPGSTITEARFWTAQSGKISSDTSQKFPLCDHWKREWFIVYPTTAAWSVTVASGPEGAEVDDFLMSDIQIEYGTTPTQYLPRLDSTARTRQGKGLQLGMTTIGYGSASPASGRYEVGDIVYSTAPASGGFIGWVCTVAGTPGTWTTFGPIT